MHLHTRSLVELNSEDTMISHKNGMKHLKKERAERDRKIKMEHEAGMSAEPERVSDFRLISLDTRLRLFISFMFTCQNLMEDAVFFSIK